MFSFHKPKVYRSSTGCCICKAKSSSSRFTDSRKYEEDFVKCFQLEERRTGEICNACVLLVKRWKKLPPGSSRNWQHVVDARAGPGIKSLTKFKAKNKKKKEQEEEPEKFDKITKKKRAYSKSDPDREQSPTESDDTAEDSMPGDGSKSSSRSGTPEGSDDTGEGEKRLAADPTDCEISNFIDLTYFKKKRVCCGLIFVGMLGEVMIEPSFLKPCHGCLARQQSQRVAAAATSLVAGSSPTHSSASASPCHSSASTSPAHSVESSTDGSVVSGKSKAFCDSSSDSGYDDLSLSSAAMDSKRIKTAHDQHPPAAAQALRLLSKAVQPMKKGHQQMSLINEKMLPIQTTLRLKSLNGTGTKMPIKLMCKPVALVSSAKLALSKNGTPRPGVESVLATVPTAIDFTTVRNPSSRQSLAN